MPDDSIAWTSFRTLEPNPYPYTPMTRSILEQGVETSSLVATVRRDTPLTAFHRGYLYFNVNEFRRIAGYFVDIPMEVLVEYLRDDTDINFGEISVSPSIAGATLLAKLGIQSPGMFLRGMTAERRLPDQPSVEGQRDGELLSRIDEHQEFLTEMVGAHVVFSAMAEAYAVGIERTVPGGPSRRYIQEIISKSTHSKTSEMAQWAANLESKEEREKFIEEFGHRCPREMEIAVPRWRDDPSTLPIGSSTNARSGDADPKAGLATKAAQVALLPGSLLERLRENPKNEWLKSYAYLRDLLLEIGRRATEAGHFTEPNDVFYVPRETACRLLEAPPSRSHTRSSVSRARRRYERNRAYSPPLFVNDEFRPVEQRRSTEDEDAVRGLGVSKGRMSGRAVTGRSPEAIDISDDGEPQILVTEFTDAGWTPLFFQIDGLVMERGSLLSHGSIVAREAGIPAVVNVSDALDRIESGDLIEVNADEGIVRLPDS